jgi:hypothetical protein
MRHRNSRKIFLPHPIHTLHFLAVTPRSMLLSLSPTVVPSPGTQLSSLTTYLPRYTDAAI